MSSVVNVRRPGEDDVNDIALISVRFQQKRITGSADDTAQASLERKREN
jgi:hypothetical protein